MVDVAGENAFYLCHRECLATSCTWRLTFLHGLDYQVIRPDVSQVKVASVFLNLFHGSDKGAYSLMPGHLCRIVG